MPDPLFALLQTRHEPIEPLVLLEALVVGAELPKVDAVRAAHRSRGILAERLTHKQAEGARGMLARSQVDTLVVPAAEMMKLTPPVSVQWLQVEERGLIVPTNYLGAVAAIPWTSIFVVSAGYVATEIRERKPHNVKQAYGGREVTVTEFKDERRTERKHVAEILGLSAEGKLLNFRLHAHRLHKQQVPQGGPAASQFEKYLLLLDDLVSHSPQAEVTPATRLILSERKEIPPDTVKKRPYDFDELSFELYNRWLLQLVMLRESGLLPVT